MILCLLLELIIFNKKNALQKRNKKIYNMYG